MWRTEAVQLMLLEDIAGLPLADTREAATEQGGRLLLAARRRAIRAVCVDLAAIVILLIGRNSQGPWLVWGHSLEVIFTLGVLVVATHAGFRIGQLEKYRLVAGLIENLEALGEPRR